MGNNASDYEYSLNMYTTFLVTNPNLYLVYLKTFFHS